MASIQQRLLQREPLDTWSVREQLCLASAVVRSGDQNWMSVSRALRGAADPNRPPDWYQQKSCAAQYGVLLEGAETPKRKKRISDVTGTSAETPQEAILKKLTADRIAELQRLMADYKSQYAALKDEISETRSPATSDVRLRELAAGVEASRRQREREQQRQALWLREREERRLRAEKTRRSAVATAQLGGLSPPASSPLLTSLLKNTSPGATPPSPIVTQMLHIPHPSTLIDAVSPSASAPTLSMLLEKGREGVVSVPLPAPAPPPSTSDAAVIEQIKSELQEIENSLRLGNILTTSPVGLAAPMSLAVTPAVPAVAPPPPQEAPMDKGPPVDIDDIEIKAEDVYAFSDMDLEIQPVSTIHKNSLTRSIEKSSFSKRLEAEEAPTLEPESPGAPPPLPELNITEEQLETGPVDAAAEQPVQTMLSEADRVNETAVHQLIELSIPLPDDPPPEQELSPVAIEQDNTTLEEKQPPLPPEPPADQLSVAAVPCQAEGSEAVGSEAVGREAVGSEAVGSEAVGSEVVGSEADGSAADAGGDDVAKYEPPAGEDARDEPPPVDHHTMPDITPKLEEIKEEVTSEGEAEDAEARGETSEGDAAASELERSPKKEAREWEEGAETGAEAEVEAEAEVATETEGEEKISEAEETHTETDDDTPMEVIREEDTGGRKRRDYSRRKTQPPSDSRACSGSESAAESAPPSPVAAAPPRAVATPTPDPDRDHRLWKKSVMLVYNRLCAHKYASLFLRPITDELAPDYSLVVRRPMDLTTIKRNIDSGGIRTTAEFQRDVLLMLSNALFYNSSRHRVHQMAQEMHQEAAAQLGMLLQAQAHAALAESHAEPPARRSLPHGKRKRLSSPLVHPAAGSPALPASKRHREE